MTAEDLTGLISDLRTAGGDTAAVEVKSAAGGLPSSITSTLSALANLPGGGLIILGVDERAGFRPVPLADPRALKQGLAAKARTFSPPVGLTVGDGTVDGAPVIVARVHECDSSAKPCRVASTGESYLRGYDGDYRLSDLEEQAFLAARKPPMFDRAPVPGSTAADLDRELVAAFVSTVRDRDPSGLGRFDDDTELLARAGVTTGDGTPTVAGVLALGVHPQQWFPRYVIQLAADPQPGDPPGTRARNQAVLSGPVPRMLESAMTWARRNFDTEIVSGLDGTVRDQPAYPLTAFRGADRQRPRAQGPRSLVGRTGGRGPAQAGPARDLEPGRALRDHSRPPPTGERDVRAQRPAGHDLPVCPLARKRAAGHRGARDRHPDRDR